MSRYHETQRQERMSVSANIKIGKVPGAALTGLDPEERIERLITTVYRKIQQIHKKEGNIPFKKRCQQVLESLENINSKPEQTSTRGERRQ